MLGVYAYYVYTRVWYEDTCMYSCTGSCKMNLE